MGMTFKRGPGALAREASAGRYGGMRRGRDKKAPDVASLIRATRPPPPRAGCSPDEAKRNPGSDLHSRAAAPALRFAPCGLRSRALLRHQRVGEIRDEIVGVLDADREPDRRIGNTDARAQVRGHARMRRRTGVAGERFRPAEADRELEDLQLVEAREGLGDSALDVERKGRAGAGALRLVDTPLRRIRGE